LHLAAANGHVEVVKMLVAKGADVNRTNVEDCTPAHRAAQGGY
jgi:ankyrin repeat protein